MKKWIFLLMLNFLALTSEVATAQTWNNPHQGTQQQNVRYSAITGSPKTLDPARAYSSDEIQILAQIYEPVTQYHYLKRPYQLVPLTASSMPTVTYYDKDGQKLADNVDTDLVAYSVYDIHILPGIYFQPHPAFAKNSRGKYIYHNMSREAIDRIDRFADFKENGTRVLTVNDYVYEIKRLASPKTHSPIFGVMSKYIKGFKPFAKSLQLELKKANEKGFLDLRKFNLSGVKVIDPHHYQITITGVYPQFKYWLAMTFFSPVPWEADAFYSQSGLEDHNITFNWYPVGTGPYMLIENNPNKQIVLVSNPNFHDERYPSTGVAGDAEKGYLIDAGKKLPFIEKVIFVLDKESIPRWNKFLQGYYDKSGVGADSFDQAIQIGKDGKPVLTPRMKQQGIHLHASVEPGIYYIGFNMLNPVVGGYGEKKKKLRQAISIALDYEEYISIFLNGRGIPAQGPIPPTIFGYENGKAGINPYVYDWFQGQPRRRSLAYARKLLRQAGYPNGINPKTGKPLILNYDVATTGSPDDKSHFDWLRDQFAKLGIKLNIRSTLYNRFQDKVRTGKVQIFAWGWLADYPDPENFLFLLYGQNAKVKYGGENASNYNNPEVNKLFEKIRAMPDGPKRLDKINELLAIVREDSPWIWGFHPITFTLSHRWNGAAKLNPMVNNSLKYERINSSLRKHLRKKWNQPKIWPLFALFIFLFAMAIPLVITYRMRDKKPTIKRK